MTVSLSELRSLFMRADTIGNYPASSCTYAERRLLDALKVSLPALLAIAEAARKALLHLDVSICECGFHLRETDAADVLRAALEGVEP